MIKMTEKEILALVSTQTDTLAGYYNKNRKVNFNGKPYILRIPIQNAVSMDMRLIPENEVLAFLAKYGGFDIPKVEMKETYDGQDYFLHSFIDGETVENVYPESDILPDWIVIEVVKAVITLHKIPLESLNCFTTRMPWKLDTKDFYDYIYSYNRGLIQKYNQDYREIFDIFGMPKDLDNFIVNKKQELGDAAFILAHSDIHRKNIIIDETIRKATIIDWELALITTTLYDISIHFHKMRYQLHQEEMFLTLYCKAFGIDKKLTEKQIRLYRDLEEVKSVAIDVVRYLSIINDISDEEIISNAKRYYSKLRKAYICWGTDLNTLKESDICEFFISRKGWALEDYQEE
ncbi:MAG: aminoglycoside phosphotransferase family protein [Treponema sp.]|jgi:thiamine kinase-like enzyme|nr:aminoglycoside phosphotransferase family protein [Treponema sp.]